MTDGVSLNVNGLVLKSAAEVDSAFKAGKISKEQANSFKAMFAATAPDPEKGTSVQKNPDKTVLTDEQKAKKNSATSLELQEMKEAKVLAEQKNLQNALAVAKKTGDDNKINAAKVVLYEFEKANKETLDSAAARLNETGKVETRGATTRIVGNAEDSALQIDPHRTAPTTVKEVKSKKQRRQEIKENASYKAEDGTVIKGKDNLKKVYKDLKHQLDDVNKEYKAAKKQYMASDHNEADKNFVDATEKLYKIAVKKKEAEVAYKTAKGKGVRKRARAQYQNEMSDNRVAQRSHVFKTKEDMKAALEAFPELKGHVAYIDDETATFIESMKNIAQKEAAKVGNSQDKLEYDQKWSSIAAMELPLDIPKGASKEEIAKILKENEKRTRLTQTALRDLAGDNKLDETEKRMIRTEVNKGKKRSNRVSRTDLNQAYTSYGLDHGNRMGARFRAAGVGALQSLPGAIAGLLIDGTKVSEVFAHASSTRTSHAISEATTKVLAIAIAHAEASVPGLSFTEIDQATGEEVLKRIAGQYDEQTVKVVEEAIAHAKAETWATATAEAHAHAKAGGKPDWLSAGIAVATGALIGFFTGNTAERGVTDGRVSKEFKDIEFIDLFKTNAARSAAADMLKARDMLVEKGVSVATANRYLENQFKLNEGIQNHTLTQRELEQLVTDFTDFAKDFKKPEIKEEEPEEPQDDQTVQETPCKDTAWIEPDHCDPIKIPRNKNGVAPIGNYVLRRGYLGPDGKPVTDEKTLNKIQRELKRREGTPQGIQRDPKDSTKLSLPLDLEIDGVIYHFDCEHGLDTIKNSKEFSQMHSTRGLAYKEPKRSGQVKTGKLMGDLCEGGVQEITQEQYDEINSKKTKK